LKDEVGAMSDIGERVKKIVVEHLGVEPDKVTENASRRHQVSRKERQKLIARAAPLLLHEFRIIL
jgi:hypothetical protein